MAYFDKRPPQAQRDANFALDWVKQHAVTREQQQAVLDTLTFKCDVLWCMLDALHHAYVTPRLISPGAFVPDPRTGEPVVAAGAQRALLPFQFAERGGRVASVIIVKQRPAIAFR